jgi:Domain of unknown function (DUF4082)/PEP-CTERM motif
MKKTLLASVAIAALTTIGGAAPACAGVVALQFSKLDTAPAMEDSSAGWSFTATERIRVTALDAFDPTGAGAGTVRLYTAKGTVLASAKVTTKDPQDGSPIKFYSAALKTPLVLAAGTYFIAEDLAATTIANGTVSGLTTTTGIKYLVEVAAAGQGKDPTTDATMGMFSPGIFGPNFEVGAVGAAVPEPATWAMMLLGFGLLGFGGARLSRRGRSRSIGLGDTA